MADEIQRMATLREDIDKVRHDLSLMCEPSRELSIAITKLDEARMWGQEALAIKARANPPGYDAAVYALHSTGA